MAASRDNSSKLVNASSLSFMLLEIDCPLTTNRLGAALSFNDSAHKEHRGQGTLLNGCFQKLQNNLTSQLAFASSNWKTDTAWKKEFLSYENLWKGQKISYFH